MFKSTLLSLAALFAFNTVYAMERFDGIYLPDGKSIEQVKSSQKEVAWDTYNVLAQRAIFGSDFLTYAYACVLKHPLATVKLAARYIPAWVLKKITGKLTAITQTLAQKETMKPFTSGEGYIQYFKQCGESSLATIAHTAAYLCKPTPATRIVTELHNENVTQRIASNIGANILPLLAARFKTVYKDDIFDKKLISGQVVDYSDFGPNKYVPNLGLIKTTKYLKPNPAFHHSYDQTFNPKYDKITVLVSNDKRILESAQKEGWAGIHFDVKNTNVAQLRERLVKLGLFAHAESGSYTAA